MAKLATGKPNHGALALKGKVGEERLGGEDRLRGLERGREEIRGYERGMEERGEGVKRRGKGNCWGRG